MNLKNKKLWIGLGIAVVLAIMIFANLRQRQKSATKVEAQKVEERELRAVVSASGKIRPKTNVDISANTTGKVVKVAVEEGDIVTKGQFLMQIDPTPAEANVRQIEASIAAARANLELDQANLTQLKVELDRQEALFTKNLASEETLQKARTAHAVQRLQTQAREQEITRLKAMLVSARHELDKVNVHSDIAGVLTKRNIEEGENVFIGAFNNPATVLLSIADLSVIEAEVEVDETDIVDVKLQQEAVITVDAYPDSSFKGIVTKVGHSPILGAGAEQQATSFEVIIQLTEEIPNVRPGLSCKAEITTGYRPKAVAVPIQALTLRKPSELKKEEPRTRRRRTAEAASDTVDTTNEDELQGAFVIKDDKVTFSTVKTGIAGDRYFEVISGLQAGDEVVTGPFKELRRLRNEDPVQVEKKSTDP